jgi:hypothetical protein
MEPSFEVKLLLNPEVLASDDELVSKLRSALGIKTSATQMAIQFLDSSDKTIYNEGWSPRIRKIQDESDFELTYKKRYPIKGTDVDAALQLASGEGFGKEGEKFKIQVEWGYEQMTLSISRKKSALDEAGGKMLLPAQMVSRNMLIGEAPDIFRNWTHIRDWGTDMLKVSRVFGPVLARRWIGFWKDVKVYVEAWTVIREKGISETVQLVEASFKLESAAEAALQREQFIALFRENGWLIEQDSSKTQLVMDRY